MTFGVFERDLTELSASALRKKYKLEQNTHRNMLRRVKDESLELDPRWKDFRSFLSDMGPKPSPEHSLDRIDGTKLAYGPGLCRWATKLEQTQNRKNTINVEFDGRALTVQEFADHIGRPYQTVYAALRRGEEPNEIAASKREQRPGDWKHPNPENEASFWNTYGRWRKKLQPPYKSYDNPAICYLLLCYNVWLTAEKNLEAMGLYETASEDDAEIARLTSSDPYRVRSMASQRVRETLDWIAARDPKLASKLTPTSSGHMHTLGEMFERATRPTPDVDAKWR